MTEQLLQFIWNSLYFDQHNLRTTAGEAIQIIDPGEWNKNQGPDFTTAHIRLGPTEWIGNIELHLKTKDWIKHRHQEDPNYANVILHVVWIDDDTSGSLIPILELQDRIPAVLTEKYTTLMNNLHVIPCEYELKQTPPELDEKWLDKLAFERLSRKSIQVRDFLKQSNGHWEEIFWWMIARNFGNPVNADSFEAMARSLPIQLIARHKHQIHQVEALLLGQCGLLSGKYQEDYPILLQKEYHFLKKKYRLKPVPLPVQFLRMRPGNFPTVRLAQLSSLIMKSVHLFSIVRETESMVDIIDLLKVTANDYWHYHYRFGEPAGFMKKTIGNDMLNNIIINTVIPLIFSYGEYIDEKKYITKVMKWLYEIHAESNSVTLIYEKAGYKPKNALQSQAFLELKKYYCDNKKCLDCKIGQRLLGRS